MSHQEEGKIDEIINSETSEGKKRNRSVDPIASESEQSATDPNPTLEERLKRRRKELQDKFVALEDSSHTESAAELNVERANRQRGRPRGSKDKKPRKAKSKLNQRVLEKSLKRPINKQAKISDTGMEAMIAKVEALALQPQTNLSALSATELSGKETSSFARDAKQMKMSKTRTVPAHQAIGPKWDLKRREEFDGILKHRSLQSS